MARTMVVGTGSGWVEVTRQGKQTKFGGVVVPSGSIEHLHPVHRGIIGDVAGIYEIDDPRIARG